MPLRDTLAAFLHVIYKYVPLTGVVISISSVHARRLSSNPGWGDEKFLDLKSEPPCWENGLLPHLQTLPGAAVPNGSVKTSGAV